MSRGITTKAIEYEPDVEPQSYPIDDDIQMSVPKPHNTNNETFTSPNNRHCAAKPKRLMKDPRVRVGGETSTTDPHEEEMKQRRLLERVRQVASK